MSRNDMAITFHPSNCRRLTFKFIFRDTLHAVHVEPYIEACFFQARVSSILPTAQHKSSALLDTVHYNLANRYLEIRNLTGDPDRSDLNLSVDIDIQDEIYIARTSNCQNGSSPPFRLPQFLSSSIYMMPFSLSAAFNVLAADFSRSAVEDVIL